MFIFRVDFIAKDWLLFRIEQFVDLCLFRVTLITTHVLLKWDFKILKNKPIWRKDLETNFFKTLISLSVAVDIIDCEIFPFFAPFLLPLFFSLSKSVRFVFVCFFLFPSSTKKL